MKLLKWRCIYQNEPLRVNLSMCVWGGGGWNGRDLNVALEENIGIFHKSPFPNLLSFCAPIKTAYIEDTFNILLISNTFLWQPLRK